MSRFNSLLITNLLGIMASVFTIIGFFLPLATIEYYRDGKMLGSDVIIYWKDFINFYTGYYNDALFKGISIYYVCSILLPIITFLFSLFDKKNIILLLFCIFAAIFSLSGTLLFIFLTGTGLGSAGNQRTIIFNSGGILTIAGFIMIIIISIRLYIVSITNSSQTITQEQQH